MSADAYRCNSGMCKRFEVPTESLGRVDMQPNPSVLRRSGHLGNRLNDPCLIVRMHQTHKQRVGTDRIDQILTADATIPLRLDKRYFKSPRPHPFKRFEHRLVLDRRTDDMTLARLASVLGKTKDRKIVAFGRPTGEKNFIPFGSHHPTNPIASPMHRIFGVVPMDMRTPRVARQQTIGIEHRLQDPRVDRIRCIAIEIDWTHSKSRICWINRAKASTLSKTATRSKAPTL